MTKQNWQEIYASGEQLNKYPYDFIVSSYFRYHNQLMKDDCINVLDLGCGAGNHSLFCAENGAQVLAVDYSESALTVVAQRATEKHLSSSINTQTIDFENFQLDEGSFDLAIDRLAVSHVAMPYADNVYNEVFKRLRPGGIFLSNLFTTEHSHKDFGEHDAGKKIWHNFNGGIFQPLKTACFYTEKEVQHLLRQYEILSLVKTTDTDMQNSKDHMEIWKIIARKPL